jgi:hypothetical protein
MMNEHRMSIQEHTGELNRCNQRGGRMLSVFDLLEANTLDLELAAYLMARISRGDSFLVGARPGGAGKTTVMCALLNLIPANRRILPATDETIAAVAGDGVAGDFCLICHEIGQGPYFSYLWGDDLCRYCALLDDGCLLATNLHADDLDEARHQICTQSGVPAGHFNGFALQIFLRVEGGYYDCQRRIDTVYASQDGADHQLVFDDRDGARFPCGALSDLVDAEWYGRCRTFLEDALQAGVRTIEAVRERFLNAL